LRGLQGRTSASTSTKKATGEANDVFTLGRAGRGKWRKVETLAIEKENQIRKEKITVIKHIQREGANKKGFEAR